MYVRVLTKRIHDRPAPADGWRILGNPTALADLRLHLGKGTVTPIAPGRGRERCDRAAGVPECSKSHSIRCGRGVSIATTSFSLDSDGGVRGSSGRGSPVSLGGRWLLEGRPWAGEVALFPSRRCDPRQSVGPGGTRMEARFRSPRLRLIRPAGYEHLSTRRRDAEARPSSCGSNNHCSS